MRWSGFGICVCMLILSVGCSKVTRLTLHTKGDINSSFAGEELVRFFELQKTDEKYHSVVTGNSIQLVFDKSIPPITREQWNKYLDKLIATEVRPDNIQFELNVQEQKLPEPYVEKFGKKRLFPIVFQNPQFGRSEIPYLGSGANRVAYCTYKVGLAEPLPTLAYREEIQINKSSPLLSETLQKTFATYNKMAPTLILKHTTSEKSGKYAALTERFMYLESGYIHLKFAQEASPEELQEAQPAHRVFSLESQDPQSVINMIKGCSQNILDAEPIFYELFLFPEISGKLVSYSYEEIWK